MTEQYKWVIQYLDGTIVEQINKDGVETKFSEILQRPTFVFNLLPIVDQSLPKVQLMITSGKRLIYFRRRIGSLNLGTLENKLDKTIYVCGWQMTVEGINIKSLLWVDHENRAVYNCDDLNIEVK